MSGEPRWSAEGRGLRQLARELVVRSPAVLIRTIPPVVGALFWLLRPEQRRGVTANLRMVRGGPASPLDHLRSLGTFVAFARSFAEGFAALSVRRDEVALEIVGEEHLRTAVGEGQGCILLTAHTSSFEVAAAGLVHAMGVPVVMAMRREPNAGGREISDAARKGAGIDIVHIDDDPLAALRLAGRLRAGAVVGLQLDRLPEGVRGVPVRLFGRPAMFPLGPFALAKATGCPVVCVFTRRTGFLRAIVSVSPPLRLEKRATEADIAEAAQLMADRLEAWVRAVPTEWLDWGRP